MLQQDPRFRAVEGVPSGHVAIEMADARRPDAVLIDIHLPDLDGFEVTRRILQRLPQTKIILMSTEKSPLYEKMSFEAGAIAFLPKDALTPEAVYRSCDAWEP